MLNFATTTQLNPSDYTNPEQLLNNFGTAFLTTLPGWSVWVVLLLALYLLPRIGRIIDKAVIGGYGLARRKPKDATVYPAAVEVEAPTQNEAIRAGLLALRLTKPDDVIITTLQTPRRACSELTPQRECALRGDLSRTADSHRPAFGSGMQPRHPR